MRSLAGPGGQIHFTHLSEASSSTLQSLFTDRADASSEPESSLLAKASSHTRGVLELMKSDGIPIDRVCLLDPKAPKELSPEDGDGRFDWFLFGVSLVCKSLPRTLTTCLEGNPRYSNPESY